VRSEVLQHRFVVSAIIIWEPASRLGRRAEGVLLKRARAFVTVRSAKLILKYNGEVLMWWDLLSAILDKRILFGVGGWERIRAHLSR